MTRIKLTGILVNDKDGACRFYIEILCFVIKHGIPMGASPTG